MQKGIQKVTQCGTLTTFFFVFIIVFSLSSSALTTFGVNKPQNNPLPATPARNLPDPDVILKIRLLPNFCEF